MRDFRDSKAMAHTLRAALATKDLKITVGQSLELTAEMFGFPDWNTLAAAIQREATSEAAEKSVKPGTDAAWPSGFARELTGSVQRAFVEATARKHEFATLEHLLLALLDDADASAVLKAGQVDLPTLREGLVAYVDSKLKAWVAFSGDRESTPTVAFRRVVHRATVRSLDRPTTGADVLASMLDETDSPATWLLRQQGMTAQAAA